MSKSIKICSLSASFRCSEDGDLLCIMHKPCKSFFLKLQAIRVQTKEMDPFDATIQKMK